jgi:hypothetical protein
MRKILLLFVLISNSSFAQKLNDYKYVIIPSKFSFVEEINQYRLNTLTKAAFENIGFVAFYDSDILPDEVANSKCNKVYADVINSSGMFMTKLNLIIKDCKNVVVYSAPIGKSREKEYKIAYVDALLESLRSLKTLNYKFSPKSAEIIENSTNVKLEIPNISSPVDTNQKFFKRYKVLAIQNGFNLLSIDSNSEVFQIFYTTENIIFIAKRNTIYGVLIKKTDTWVFEYYEDNVLKSEAIKIDF